MWSKAPAGVGGKGMPVGVLGNRLPMDDQMFFLTAGKVRRAQCGGGWGGGKKPPRVQPGTKCWNVEGCFVGPIAGKIAPDFGGLRGGGR